MATLVAAIGLMLVAGPVKADAVAAAVPVAADAGSVGVTTVLTTVVQGQGNINRSPDDSEFAYEDSVMLTAAANPDWAFSHWEGDLEPDNPWWNAYWSYRVPLLVGANGHRRRNRVVSVEMNFTDLLVALGESGEFESKSIRVVEIDDSGSTIDQGVRFQFEPADDYDAATNAAGTLLFYMAGVTQPDDGRTYYVYFDTTDKAFSPPAMPALVDLGAATVDDEGRTAYVITTQNATYYFHITGGALSSLDDDDGNDWINYNLALGADGAYRGIPNAIHPESDFHPGRTTATTAVLFDGPLRLTLLSKTSDDKWHALWQFYPTYVTFTMLKIDHDYWFLYEGTPGGALETDSDFVVRASGSQTPASVSWQQDLDGEEWVYFADPVVDRSLYFINHIDDNIRDSYFPMDGKMTVFGFGRLLSSVNPELTATPGLFTFGLVDGTAYAQTAKVIRDALVEPAVQIAAPETETSLIAAGASASNSIMLPMKRNRTVTAIFERTVVTLTTAVSGMGNIIRSPDLGVYPIDEDVRLSAVPDACCRFAGWTGDVTTSATPLTLTLTADTLITATFALREYVVSTGVTGEGTVTRAPEQALYEHGQNVQLTATAAPGWQLAGWSEPALGAENVISITVVSALDIEANFVRLPVLAVTKSGEGSVHVAPPGDYYPIEQHVVLTATPDVGWVFGGWVGADATTDNPLTIVMDDDRNILANFLPLHTLTLQTEGAGTVAASPANDEYVFGEEVIVTATPAAGWLFVGWSGDASGSANPNTIVIDGDLTVRAFFIRGFTLSTQVQGAGRVTLNPDSAGYRTGTLVEVQALPEADAEFVEWRGDAAGSSNPVTVLMGGDRAVTAIFARKAQDIGAIGAGHVTVSPDRSSYLESDLVTLTAVPDPGWYFSGWEGVDERTAQITIPYANARTVQARFAKLRSLFLPILRE